jgi:hypothetical protein
MLSGCRQCPAGATQAAVVTGWRLMVPEPLAPGLNLSLNELKSFVCRLIFPNTTPKNGNSTTAAGCAGLHVHDWPSSIIHHTPVGAHCHSRGGCSIVHRPKYSSKDRGRLPVHCLVQRKSPHPMLPCVSTASSMATGHNAVFTPATHYRLQSCWLQLSCRLSLQAAECKL